MTLLRKCRKCSDLSKLLVTILCTVLVILLCFEIPLQQDLVKNVLVLQQQLDESQVKLKQCIVQKREEHIDYLKERPSVPISARSLKGIPGKRLVHLDLKGAPPKMSYLLQLLPIFADLGVSGLLVEYEDMFPYTGKLRVLSSKNAYSFDEIDEFVNKANELYMTVMPLVPTLGHFEFVLKHINFQKLRETPKYSNMPCPLHDQTQQVVVSMIDQMLAAHPSITYLHLGGDEAYNLKTCDKCSASNMSKADLYLHHMLPLFNHVKEKTHSKVRPVIWDDMLRKWSVADMQKLSSLTDIMIWSYVANVKENSQLPPSLWSKYSEAFDGLWLASSFKGAYSAINNLVPISMHIKNHESWLELTKHIKNKIKGIAITGWSRYDHMSSLCELLPASIPSLGLCLRTLSEGSMKLRGKDMVETILGFTTRPIMVEKDVFDSWDTTTPGYPGGEIYSLVAELENHVSWYDSTKTRFDSWANNRQVEQEQISLFQLNGISESLKQLIPSFKSFRKKCLTTLSTYYYEDTVNEWVIDKVDSYITLSQALDERLTNVKTKLRIDL